MGKNYESGEIILADRYTTSNMVHQAAKIQDLAEKDAFLDWLWILNLICINFLFRLCFLDMLRVQQNPYG